MTCFGHIAIRGFFIAEIITDSFSNVKFQKNINLERGQKGNIEIRCTLHERSVQALIVYYYTNGSVFRNHSFLVYVSNLKIAELIK